jgi:hypothetical protein
LTIRLGITCEQKFFQLISEELPVLEFLAVSNPYRLRHKELLLTPIMFPCLSLLDLYCAHVDYAELFLLKANMNLPRLVNLIIECESLTTITNYFTNDATNFNFATLKSLDVCHPFVQPKNFREYFPLLTSIKRQILTW